MSVNSASLKHVVLIEQIACLFSIFPISIDNNKGLSLDMLYLMLKGINVISLLDYSQLSLSYVLFR